MKVPLRKIIAPSSEGTQASGTPHSESFAVRRGGRKPRVLASRFSVQQGSSEFLIHRSLYDFIAPQICITKTSSIIYVDLNWLRKQTLLGIFYSKL
jgi:hypothetical protein